MNGGRVTEVEKTFCFRNISKPIGVFREKPQGVGLFSRLASNNYQLNEKKPHLNTAVV